MDSAPLTATSRPLTAAAGTLRAGNGIRAALAAIPGRICEWLGIVSFVPRR